ncbi:MAG: HDOD domain-containing protein [Proteobacteria bacterium]|nr:HDOD domain-containing protein [Pseudomonadota bacterium]MCP4916914.1 HDOD domain-containing protein [Pseudomonadota bacterium]
MIERDRIARDLNDLPMISQAVVRLIPILRDERASAGKVAACIQTDPGLTATVLRIANSPAYGTRQIGDVKRAAAMLGTRTLFEVVTSAALAEVVPDEISGYGLDASEFWVHCTAVAVLAESLGRTLGHPTPDLTYSCALLHDIGKLVIGQYLSEKMPSVVEHLQTSEAPPIEFDRQVLGTDHAEVGASVALAWNLPEELVEGIRSHHDPDQAEPGPLQTMADLVHVADAMAHSFGYGADVGGLRRAVSPGAAERLELEPGIIELVAATSMSENAIRADAMKRAA